MRYIFAFNNDKPPVQIHQDDIIRYLNFIKKQFDLDYNKWRMVAGYIAQACSLFYKNHLLAPQRTALGVEVKKAATNFRTCVLQTWTVLTRILGKAVIVPDFIE